jgi:ATP-dependent exoDNAse (exonuclease V) beta subunit
MQSSTVPADIDDSVKAFARRLLTPGERVSAAGADIDAIVDEAVGAWRSLRMRKDVAALLSGDRILHEVPFSMVTRQSGRPVVLRGVIDCLVQRNDGSVLVVEFKTGRPRPSHEQQLGLYIQAAASIYPGARVEGRLVYAE